MEDFKFCPVCAAGLEKKKIEGRKRLACTSCGWINYLNPLPVISALVVNKRKELLLIKRGVEPSKGCWALPGGFMEIDETPIEAGKRELFEETGIKGSPGRLVGVMRHQSPMYGSILMVGFEFLIDDERITIGDDAMDAKFFPTEDLPEIPFESHRKLIQSFLTI